MMFKIFIILFFLLSFCYNSFSSNDYKELRSTIKKEEKELLQLKNSGKDLSRKINLINSKLENHKNALRLLNDTIKGSSNRLKKIEQDVSNKEREIKENKRAISRSMVYLVDSLQHGVSNILIGRDDKVDVIASMEILTLANDKLLRHIDVLNLDIKSLDILKLDAKVESDNLTSIKALREIELKAVVDESNSYKKALAEVKNDENAQKAVVNNLKQRERAIERRLKELADRKKRELAAKKKREANSRNQREDNRGNDSVVDSSSGFAKSKGSLAYPIKGKTTVRFGRQLIEDANTYFFNKGIRISSFSNTSVILPYDGTVQFADYVKGFLNLVIVSHDGGYYTVYGNLSTVNVSSGDILKKGSSLGMINGSSLMPSELYLEVRKSEDALNPEIWFR